MQTQLGKWGNSTGLRIPAEMLVHLGGDKNARVEITGLPAGGLLVQPVAAGQSGQKTPAQWAQALREAQREMPLTPAVVRQMRDEQA